MYDRVWVCRDGTMLTVSQMQTSHIKNCIALIMRKRNWRREFLPRLLLELDMRSRGLK